MTLELDDVIAAPASPPGPAARGVVRLTGNAVREIVSRVFDPADPELWASARLPRVHPGCFHLAGVHIPLSVGVYLWPTRRSYTGQPSAEIHMVGSPPMIEAVLGALYENGARPARQGEFTLRAFLSGRIDLVQAEAVLGVIDADDQVHLEAALRQLAGGVSGKLAAIRADLIDLLADLEAGLDFVEDDVEFISRENLTGRLQHGLQELTGLQSRTDDRMQTTGRRRVVLAGLPNAGKSTLFNALAGRDHAIVSPVQGTTRDWLSADVEWRGVAVELVDTAGWESAQASIEEQAQAFRDEQIDRARLIVWCTPADLAPAAFEADVLLRNTLRDQGRPLLEVVTKADLQTQPRDGVDGVVRVSATSKLGLAELADRAAERLSDVQSTGSDAILGSTASRCRESLYAAAAALANALAAVEAAAGEELISIEIRESLDHLGRILGVVYTDDVLDRVFQRFCIGK